MTDRNENDIASSTSYWNFRLIEKLLFVTRESLPTIRVPAVPFAKIRYSLLGRHSHPWLHEARAYSEGVKADVKGRGTMNGAGRSYFDKRQTAGGFYLLDSWLRWRSPRYWWTDRKIDESGTHFRFTRPNVSLRFLTIRHYILSIYSPPRPIVVCQRRIVLRMDRTIFLKQTSPFPNVRVAKFAFEGTLTHVV